MSPDQKRIVELTERLGSALMALATILNEPDWNEPQARKILEDGIAALRARRLFVPRELR